MLEEEPGSHRCKIAGHATRNAEPADITRAIHQLIAMVNLHQSPAIST